MPPKRTVLIVDRLVGGDAVLEKIRRHECSQGVQPVAFSSTRSMTQIGQFAGVATASLYCRASSQFNSFRSCPVVRRLNIDH